MANNENLIPIPGRLHSVATEGHVSGADEIYDDVKEVTQDVLNGAILEEKTYTPTDYSGMGRVVLKKNMVNDVNTLTQDMFYKGEAGSRVPNTDTIYVIQYDFTLGEDTTIPANCVLEFDGGSLSNGNINFNNCIIEADKFTQIFKNITISADYKKLVWATWFINNSDTIDVNDLNTVILRCYEVHFPEGSYMFNDSIEFTESCKCFNFIGNGGNNECYTYIKNVGTNRPAIIIGTLMILRGFRIDSDSIGEYNETTKEYEGGASCILLQASHRIYDVYTAGGMYGIYKDPQSTCTFSRIEDSYFTYAGNAGIYFASQGNGSTNSQLIRRCYIVKCGHGADNIHNPGRTNYKTTGFASGHGIFIADGNVTIEDTVCEYNIGIGLFNKNLNNKRLWLKVNNCAFEQNGATAIVLDTRNMGVISSIEVIGSKSTYPIERPSGHFVPKFITYVGSNNITEETYNTIYNVKYDSYISSNVDKNAFDLSSRIVSFDATNIKSVVEDNVYSLRFYPDSNDEIRDFTLFRNIAKKTGYYKIGIQGKQTGNAALIIKINPYTSGLTYRPSSSLSWQYFYIGVAAGQIYDLFLRYFSTAIAEDNYFDICNYSFEECVSISNRNNINIPIVGVPIYDENLGKIVVYNGSGWVDATGAPV